MHAYTVYGLVLHSDFPIPELRPHEPAAAEVTVRLVSSTGTPSPGEAQDESWAERDAVQNETLCVFAGVGRYRVQAGSTISVQPDPEADAALVRHFLLGPVLAHLLWQRGTFTLHASVIELEGRHVAFVGASGEGKSTTAAALVARGHRLVCDDIAALSLRGHEVLAAPAFPRIRLYADSLRGLGEEPSALPFVHARIDKRLKSVESFASAPVRLDHLYLLASGDAFTFAPLRPGDSVMEVVRHTYYGHQFAPLYGFKTQLEQAARIAERLPAYRFTRPRELARLSELVHAVERHAAS